MSPAIVPEYGHTQETLLQFIMLQATPGHAVTIFVTIFCWTLIAVNTLSVIALIALGIMLELKMNIYRERPGVISDEPVWVCFCDCYMYTGDTLWMLLRDMWKYWRKDNRLIG